MDDIPSERIRTLHKAFGKNSGLYVHLDDLLAVLEATASSPEAISTLSGRQVLQILISELRKAVG